MQSLSSVQPSVLPIAKKFFREPPSCLSKMFSCFGAQDVVVSAEEQQANDALVQHIRQKIRPEIIEVYFPRLMAELQKSEGDLTVWKERGAQSLLGLNDEQCLIISGFMQHRNPGLLRPFYTASASAFLKAVGYGFAQRHLGRVDMFWKIRWSRFSVPYKANLAIQLNDVNNLQQLMQSPQFEWGTSGYPIEDDVAGYDVDLRGVNRLHRAAYYNHPKILEALLNGGRDQDAFRELLKKNWSCRMSLLISDGMHFSRKQAWYTPAGLATMLEHREVLQVFLKQGLYTKEDFSVAFQLGNAKLVDFINSCAAKPFPITFQDCFLPLVGHDHGAHPSTREDLFAVRQAFQQRRIGILRFFKQFLYQFNEDPGALGFLGIVGNITALEKSMSRDSFKGLQTGHQEVLLLLAGHPHHSFVGSEIVFGDLNGRLTIQPGNHSVEPIAGLHPASGSTDVADFLRMPNTGAHRRAFLARGLQLAVKYQCPVAAAYFLEQGAVWDKNCDKNKALVLAAIQQANCDLLAVLSLYGMVEKQTIVDSFREAFVGEEVPKAQQKIQELDTAIEAVCADQYRNFPALTLALGTQAQWLGDGAHLSQELDRSVGRFAANETFDRNIFGLIQDFTNGVGPRRIR